MKYGPSLDERPARSAGRKCSQSDTILQCGPGLRSSGFQGVDEIEWAVGQLTGHTDSRSGLHQGLPVPACHSFLAALLVASTVLYVTAKDSQRHWSGHY